MLVLGRKAGRFKPIIQPLKVDLDAHKHRLARGRHEATITNNWNEIKHATY